MQKRKLWCCGCGTLVKARLSDGAEIYPHRGDLSNLPFWKCDGCGNFVGCHHKTKDRTKPLGFIPTAEIKQARQHIHRILDPIWKHGRMKRSAVYAEIAKRMGIAEYHTAEIKSVDEARAVYRHVRDLAQEARD